MTDSPVFDQQTFLFLSFFFFWVRLKLFLIRSLHSINSIFQLPDACKRRDMSKAWEERAISHQMLPILDSQLQPETNLWKRYSNTICGCLREVLESLVDDDLASFLQ